MSEGKIADLSKIIVLLLVRVNKNHMKQFIIGIIIAGAITSCTSGNKAHITGLLSGVSDDTLYLELVTTKERKIVDSAITNKQGEYKFSVHLPVNTPTFYNIIHKQCVIPLIISGGERVKVNSLCNLQENYTVEGSPESEILKKYNTLYHNGIGRLDSLSRLYSQTQPLATDDNRRKELLTEYTREFIQFKRENIAFVVSNATYMATIYSLYQRLPNNEPLFNLHNDYAYYNLVADSLSARYPQSPHVMALLRDVSEEHKAQEAALQIQQKINVQDSKFPEIELPDTQNKTQKLSSFTGKVILVDFWSITDSRSGIVNAELKETYDIFKKHGFEVFQVSMDDNKANWINVVRAQRLPWISVNDPRGLGGLPAMSYNIGSLPGNILIDKKGVIVGRNLYGSALQAKLSALTL